MVTRLSILLAGMLLLVGTASAQLNTLVGNFFQVDRTVEDTADSVDLAFSGLIFQDEGGTVEDFQSGDSVCIFFSQNRYRFANGKKPRGEFDGVKVESRSAMLLRSYMHRAGIKDTSVLFLKPVYRRVGSIAGASLCAVGPERLRQSLSFQLVSPSPDRDRIVLTNLWIKPNINNLTGLLAPPDTTKDTLRAYILDRESGTVVASTDLAIVRLLPGTTRVLQWVRDSAQVLEAGEYIGSFGDYSRGRYVLADDGLDMKKTSTAHLRPGLTNPVTNGPNPDFGLLIDGFPPEKTPIRQQAIYAALQPTPTNPDGVIPPYRSATRNQTWSGADTLRFLDAWGNRTFDTVTIPRLKTVLVHRGKPMKPGAEYINGVSGRDDMLRQVGQVVFRRLAYIHAGGNGSYVDTIRIVAEARVKYRTPNGRIRTLTTVRDTTGGAVRTAATEKLGWTIRQRESSPDNGPRTSRRDDTGHPGPSFTALDEPGATREGYIVVRSGIPRRIQIAGQDLRKGRLVNEFSTKEGIILEVRVSDGYGNPCPPDTPFQLEVSPFSPMRLGSFKQLEQHKRSRSRKDSKARRWLFKPVDTTWNAGTYVLRGRASWNLDGMPPGDPSPASSKTTALDSITVVGFPSSVAGLEILLADSVIVSVSGDTVKPFLHIAYIRGLDKFGNPVDINPRLVRFGIREFDRSKKVSMPRGKTVRVKPGAFIHAGLSPITSPRSYRVVRYAFTIPTDILTFTLEGTAEVHFKARLARKGISTEKTVLLTPSGTVLPHPPERSHPVASSEPEPSMPTEIDSDDFDGRDAASIPSVLYTTEICVSDIDASRRFYTEVLGFKAIEETSSNLVIQRDRSRIVCYPPASRMCDITETKTKRGKGMIITLRLAHLEQWISEVGADLERSGKMRLEFAGAPVYIIEDPDGYTVRIMGQGL